MRAKQRLGEPDALFAKDQGVAGGIDRAQIADAGKSAEEVQTALRALARPRPEKSIEVGVLPNVDEMPVVHARTTHAVLVDSKAERADQVQRASRGRAQPRDIAGIGRDLGLDEDDVQRWDKWFRAEAWRGLGGHALIYPGKPGSRPE